MIVATWIGALGFGSALLAASVIVPLSGLAVTLVIAVVVVASFASPAVRAELAAGVAAPARRLLPPLAVLATLAALFSRRVDYFDSGSYHLGIIEWLTRFGTVPGVALVHSRLGFGSSWFGLGAAFSDGFLHARMAALPGALAVLLGVAHLAVAGRRVLARGEARPWDVFLVVGLAIVLISVPDDLMISPSPDLPAALLIVEAAWLFLRSLESPSLLAGAALLAVGAAGVKLQAAPFAVCMLVAAAARLRPLRSVIGLGAMAVVLVGPTLAYNTVASGCPLFPAPPCLAVSWRLPGREVARLRTTIRDFGRGTLGAPAAEDAGLRWIWREWLRPRGRSRSTAAVALGAVALAVAGEVVRRRVRTTSRAFVGLATAVLVVGLLSRRLGGLVLTAAVLLAVLSAWKARIPGLRALSLMSLGGLGFVLAYGPLLRFGYGYVAIAFAAFATGVVWPRTWAVPRPTPRHASAVLAVLLVSTFAYVLVRNPADVVLPPHVATPEVEQRTAAGFTYSVPVDSGQCWASPVPCAPRPAPADRRLRDPDDGVGSGFVTGR